MSASDPKKNKDNLAAMLRCCDAQARDYWQRPAGGRSSAAPYCFERAAILLRKKGDYAGEVEVCTRWASIMDDYSAQDMVMAGRASLTHEGPSSRSILSRLGKAQELLANPPPPPKPSKAPKTKAAVNSPARTTLPPLSGKVTGTDDCDFNIVGESHYQTALRRLRNSRHMATDNDFVAYIVTEPDNSHDKNACAVYIDGLKVGYLPRSAAVEFVRRRAAEGIAGACRFKVKAMLSGGWGGRSVIGVRLNLPNG